MSLDGRLVGRDDYEFSEYYEPLVASMQKALAASGTKTDIAVGEAGQDFKMEIGKGSDLQFFRSYAAYVSVHGKPPAEPDISMINHELNEIIEGRSGFGAFPQLINHSDSNGYYIAVDFENPFTIDAPSFGGGETWKCDIGSCHALLRELDELNKHLKVPGDVGQLNGTAMVEQEIRGDVFEKEKMVWAVMHWLAREATERNLLLEFC
ncbi:MAG: hypothetical protein SGJ27_09260 [Candidatus Melainabacteria bacterium]|nr:hypothetical protein [Candidatus Melainabacteria bacterium]